MSGLKLVIAALVSDQCGAATSVALEAAGDVLITGTYLTAA